MFVNVNTNPQAPDDFKELFRRIAMMFVIFFSVFFMLLLAAGVLALLVEYTG